jgi:hypothetical protein
MAILAAHRIRLQRAATAAGEVLVVPAATMPSANASKEEAKTAAVRCLPAASLCCRLALPAVAPVAGSAAAFCPELPLLCSGLGRR